LSAYYNEIDPFAAAWLRELIRAGLIADGTVDERDIRDVAPDDLAGFVQCHFFAGIGVWSYALKRAGWPDERPVWTGSCPCQPFSAAGKRGGTSDERHLWPSWFHLIAQQRPAIVFGEQVASKDGLGWLDLVHADLEGADYSIGVADLCAAGVGSPHTRQRLWFVAERLADAERERGRCWQPRSQDAADAWLAGEAFRLADTDGRDPSAERQQRGWQQRQQPEDGGAGGLGHSDSSGAWRHAGAGAGTEARSGSGGQVNGHLRDGPDMAGRHGNAGPVNSIWRDADWLFCRDGKWRPVEPGTFPLAHGAPARVGRLRGYGNAIVAEAAATFIQSYLEVREAA